ncbi:TRAP dicarboxylate transporter, DctM subunit [Pseudovibrio sp. FO-BEG1]|uniref:TRAP transporter large permease protein n=1 Tax=Pseudovibrio denitrificans TaxID=258256 RepID=A0A1I7DQ90_9HYPH|nr:MULTISPECIES: TRAP transporter large permease subunit [Pseudovibrio]AEV39432.1 TRAP dicarboxylate transporter, DctM subunit [Pseudovibrio sp. FO-BEG1]EEA92970.1 trap-type c4-dicarboxylate transport system, large permease component [Pseudovibrio sp. JE062]SFU13784.1 C4-dicarboxylate transporter, DctM subunit [Pseudovibrio denitrificans]
METAVLFLLLFGLLLIGAPIAIALGLSSVLYIALFSHDSMSSVTIQMFNASQNFTLLAIPFFILASSFMSTGGVARRIVNFAVATVGWVRGGLAMAGVLACMIFAALSGSSPATVVAIGTIAIAAMRQAGYSKEFAAGIIANAGTLGILIPPSIVMVVYAAATNVSVGRMFLAGVIPGIVAGLMLMVTIYFIARKKNLAALPFPSMKVLWTTFAEAAFGMFLIVIILGGIYAGVFTPTEAAAVAAVYACLIALFIYRDMGPLKDKKWRKPGESLIEAVGRNIGLLVLYFFPAFFHRDTRKVLVESGKTTIMLMFIIVNALLFAHTLTAERIPQIITDWMIGAGFNWFTFLIAVNIILLIGGQFMEPSGLLLIVAPVVFPIAIELGVDPIHLGIIMVVNMEIGMITPPIGLNLFVTSGITGMSLVQVVRAAAPFVMVLLVFLVLVTYLPWLSTALPTYMMGPEVIVK